MEVLKFILSDCHQLGPECSTEIPSGVDCAIWRLRSAAAVPVLYCAAGAELSSRGRALPTDRRRPRSDSCSENKHISDVCCEGPKVGLVRLAAPPSLPVFTAGRGKPVLSAAQHRTARHSNLHQAGRSHGNPVTRVFSVQPTARC